MKFIDIYHRGALLLCMFKAGTNKLAELRDTRGLLREVRGLCAKE